MRVATLCKAKLGQPPGLVASPRDDEGNRPRRVTEYRQGNAVVAGHEGVGSPSPTCAVAIGSQSTPGFGIFKCKDKRCFTSPKYITEHNFKSNITKKRYNITNH